MTFKPGDVLVPWRDSWTAQSRYWVANRDEEGAFMWVLGGNPAMGDLKVDLQAQEPPPEDVFVKPREGTEEREVYQRLESYVGHYLSEGARSLNNVLKALAQESGRDARFIEGCVRVMVAQQDLLAAGSEGAIKLSLSESSKRRERYLAFVSSFAHELAGQADQIGLLIGHNPTVGSYREDLFRNLLKRHIPQRFHAATGFIAGFPNQLDILIYDQLDYAPLFRDGDLVVVPAKAVRAIIEVKSRLDASTLRDALKHLHDATPLRGRDPPIFTGVFAYAGATTPTLIAGWREFHDMGDSEREPDPSDLYLISDIGTTVTAICVLRQTLLISTYIPTTIDAEDAFTPALMQVESFAKRNAEAAMFYETLLRYLRHPFDGPLPTDDDRISALTDSVGTLEPAFGRTPWGPFMIEDRQAIAEYWSNLQAFDRWFGGESWELRPPAKPYR